MNGVWNSECSQLNFKKAVQWPNGLECPPDSLEEVNQMMSSIGRALIQWNENQADYIRV